MRSSLNNSYPMVRKEAGAGFSLLTLRCLCAINGLAYKAGLFPLRYA